MKETTDPKIVFCTTCKGRLQYLEKTLPANIKSNKDYPNCQFVILAYGDKSVRDYLLESHKDLIASGRVVGYGHRADAAFHMAHAKNLAARCGILEKADILVTLDADNFTGEGFARWIAEQFKAYTPDNRFVCCPNFKHIHSMPHGPERPARGYAGRLAIRAQDFIKAGGYDEIYDTWRGEDMDMLYRLQRMGYKLDFFDNKFLDAIRHNSAIRFKEYPDAKQYETDQYLEVIAARTQTVVNFGKFGVGEVFRNFARGIHLHRVPTRIFGIGLHRTATTSLHKAFEILGYDSFHFRSGNEARMIWEEMNIWGRSTTLERWYALSDLPIPLLYKKLDVAYPGSKFILTVRKEHKWLESVKRLWSPECNPLRYTWDQFPISHRLHKALYGRQDFDPKVFLSKYKQHNAEVIEYFKNRPHDLLIMDMDADDGWPRLCRFLDAPVPNSPYPNEQHTTRKAM